MPNALKILIAGSVFTVGLSGCHKQDQANNAASDLNGDAMVNEAVPPADVEALPPDESSETPSNQLVNGDDAPDVNEAGETNSD